MKHIIRIFLILLLLGAATMGFAQGAGQALTFDGNDDYVGAFGDVLDMGTNDWTVSAWFKTTGANVSGGIVGKSSYRSNFGRWSVVFETGWLEVIFQYSGSGVITHHIGNVNQWNDNKWHNVTAVFKRSSNLETYIDGAFISSISISAANGININNSDIFLIGRYQNVNGDGPHPTFGKFIGPIDEIRIWNRALTASEIQERLCKKLTSSDGYWANLLAYWRFDSTSGTTLTDEKGTYNGTLLPLTSEPTWGWSGAAIGDASAYDYTGTNPSDFAATISHGDGDNLSAVGSGGTVKGIQVYRVDSTSLRTGATNPTGWNMDPLRYWGAFIAGTSNPLYTATYYYNGHPGITNPTSLKLGGRANLSVNAWSDLSATLNTGTYTLVKTGQTSAEYALGSTDDTLPIELSSFTAILSADFFVKLHWTTQSETGVSGFYIYRGKENSITNAIVVSPIIDATNTTEQQSYEYVDSELFEPGTYYYWLSVQNLDGSVEYHGPTTVYYDNSTNHGTPGIPIINGLNAIYPNPFNPSTTISYGLAKESDVDFIIYNSRGQIVRRIEEGQKSAGNWKLNWNGLDDSGASCATGVYYIRMQTGKDSIVRKAVLLK